MSRAITTTPTYAVIRAQEELYFFVLLNHILTCYVYAARFFATPVIPMLLKSERSKSLWP